MRFGRYTAIEILGQGHAGIVYKATHPDRTEPIALKVVFTDDKDLVEAEQYGVEHQ
ncbi:MAG: hypothetical protein HKN21_05730, partial [Candidatus Eisenbacteria bacterium]|nr:hypothetical protein [Candidatus Eisenbacteria bacterium]